MNVAAFIVAAVNIPQIIECSSPESATFDKFCFTPVRAHSNSRVLVSVSLRVFCNCAHSAGFTRHRRSAWRKGGGPLLPFPHAQNYIKLKLNAPRTPRALNTADNPSAPLSLGVCGWVIEMQTAVWTNRRKCVSATARQPRQMCITTSHTRRSRTRVAYYEPPRQAPNTGPPAQTSTRTCHSVHF